MKHIGIVAEYNPFHNGHAYQIQRLKEIFPNKQVIAIMSGNFVQRGEPAVFEKSLRTKCALAGGADIVFELPVHYAVSSAEYFACAALQLLAATGVVDTVCFGAECDDLSLLNSLADLLIQEPGDYQTALKQYLSDGYSFPKARKLAVCHFFQNTDIAAVLDQPNNILAIEYLKAIKRLHLPLTPIAIKRKDSSYHNTSLTEKLPSATALRKQLENMSPLVNFPSTLCDCIATYIPPDCLSVLFENDYAKPLFFSDFHASLQYALWANYKQYGNFFDVPSELANRLDSAYQKHLSIEELIEYTAGKNYTHARIRRILFHILLNITSQDSLRKEQDCLSYLRLLGFRRHAASILHDMKTVSSVPVINKIAAAKEILNNAQYSRFEKELHIHTLYKQIFAEKYGIAMPCDHRQSIIITD